MNLIYCKKHGRKQAYVVCTHVALEGAPAYAPDSQEQGEPDAWCYECHKLNEEEAGYTGLVERHACITAICPDCLQEQLQAQSMPASKPWWQFWRSV